MIDIPDSWTAKYLADVATARELGSRMGFGALMQATERAWRDFNAANGIPLGSEHSVGPCVALLVACPGCPVARRRGAHCDWCCGSGRVTKRVAEAIESSRHKPGKGGRRG